MRTWPRVLVLLAMFALTLVSPVYAIPQIIDSNPYFTNSQQSINGTFPTVPGDIGVSAVAQNFRSPGDVSLSRADFNVSANPTTPPTDGNLQAMLFQIGSSDIANALPVGNPLALSDLLDATAIPTIPTVYSFNFSGQQVLNKGGYAVALASVGITDPGVVRVWEDRTAPHHPGNETYYDANLNSWNFFNEDLHFAVWGEPFYTGAGTSQGTVLTVGGFNLNLADILILVIIGAGVYVLAIAPVVERIEWKRD